MQPFKGGGDMIRTVTFEKTTYNTIPHKFEAGTPPIAAAIGLGAAVDYLSAIGMAGDRGARARAAAATRPSSCSDMPGVRILGTARDKAAVLSFALDGIHPHDVGTLLNQEGIAVRTGHHCAQPLMKRLRRARRPRAPRSRSTTRWPRSMRWSPASAACRRCSHEWPTRKRCTRR